MACTITNSRTKLYGIGPEQVDEAIEKMLEEGRTCFFVEKSAQEQLSVVFTDKGCSVIYTNYEPAYIALDASTEPLESSERFIIKVDNEPTPIPANMKLHKRQTRQIIKDFCTDGQLSKSIYWLKEGPSPNANRS